MYSPLRFAATSIFVIHGHFVAYQKQTKLSNLSKFAEINVSWQNLMSTSENNHRKTGRWKWVTTAKWCHSGKNAAK